MTTTTTTLPEALQPSRIEYIKDTTPAPLTARTVEPNREAYHRDLAKQRILTLSSRYARHARWQLHVQAYIDSGCTAEYNVRKMPSKASKHWMYDDAAAVRQLLTDLGYAGVPGRPHTLYGVGLVVTFARNALGMRTLKL